MQGKRRTNWRNTIIIIVVAVAVAILFGLVGLAILIIILLIYYWRRGRSRRAGAVAEGLAALFHPWTGREHTNGRAGPTG